MPPPSIRQQQYNIQQEIKNYMNPYMEQITLLIHTFNEVINEVNVLKCDVFNLNNAVKNMNTRVHSLEITNYDGVVTSDHEESSDEAECDTTNITNQDEIDITTAEIDVRQTAINDTLQSVESKLSTIQKAFTGLIYGSPIASRTRSQTTASSKSNPSNPSTSTNQ